MDNSNKQEFATLFFALGEYYDKKVSKELLAMLFDDLIEFDINDVKFGAKAHRQDPKHGTFFPKAADIIRHLQTGKLSTEEKAMLAWGQIIQELRANGVYGNLVLDDKQAIAALKAVHSWKDFCLMPEKDLTWAKKEFLANYKVYENTPVELLPSSLPGLIELQHHKKEQSKSMQNILEGINKLRLTNNK